jgi:hypothetical protein
VSVRKATKILKFHPNPITQWIPIFFLPGHLKIADGVGGRFRHCQWFRNLVRGDEDILDKAYFILFPILFMYFWFI